MIVLAIAGTVAAILWSLVVIIGNGMSDAPSAAFQGVPSLVAAWAGSATLWLAWWFN